MADHRNYSDTALAFLRANLGFYGSEIPEDLETYLMQLLSYAYDAFDAMGISPQPGVLADDMDQAIFAAWLYRNGPSGAGKTQQLRDMIRNRQVHLAMEGQTHDL